jgi:pantetheine-phosphate adenylyltransferase
MSTARPKRARHVLFPGTFDPVTLGHVDLVRRAAASFDRVTVAVATHPTKRGLFDVEERVALLHEVLAGFSNVSVTRLEGLVVDGCRAAGAGFILRGLRSAADVDYELAMARSNRALAPEVETVLLASSPAHAHISSTLVRQIAEMGGELRSFVPPAVARALRRRAKRH